MQEHNWDKTPLTVTKRSYSGDPRAGWALTGKDAPRRLHFWPEAPPAAIFRVSMNTYTTLPSPLLHLRHSSPGISKPRSSNTMLAQKTVQTVRPAQASRRVAVKPVAQLKPAQKVQLAAAAAVVGLAAAHPVRGSAHCGVSIIKQGSSLGPAERRVGNSPLGPVNAARQRAGEINVGLPLHCAPRARLSCPALLSQLRSCGPPQRAVAHVACASLRAWGKPWPTCRPALYCRRQPGA